ncbi:hypothetical protein ACH5RR_007857 [Cinchona calisaya]|uniref:RING-type E3 ubiquitin transferase n=1 Tax=Cinchona calisaya TaxID=153742 RepID=A0ABD3ADD1_9GENT
MGDSSLAVGSKLDDSGVIELTGKIMVVVVLLLFLVMVFLFFLHLHSKWFCHRRQEQESTTNTRRRHRLHFAPGHQELNVLDPSVLKTIPVVAFFSVKNDFKDGLECAVCLCEVSEAEKIRLLPKCNHGFHVECIDMWFASHSTCPLCRNPIANQSLFSRGFEAPNQENNAGAANGYSTEVLNFPTNVLFWGNEAQVSTLGPCLENDHHSASTSNGSDGMLVIDIPSNANEDEEQKSPMPTRLRSFKRLLSRDRRVSPRSVIDFDVEQQGGRGES